MPPDDARAAHRRRNMSKRPLRLPTLLIAIFAVCASGAGAPDNKTDDLATATNDNNTCDESEYAAVCDNKFNVSASIVIREETVPAATIDLVKLWNDFPKVIIPTNASSERCRLDVSRLLKGIQNLELWALKMIDSTAKLPSGILHGNINQYGDFDQCLSVKGKYCLTNLQISFRGNPFDLPEFDALIQAHYAMRSNMTDPGHRVPRFSTIMWGVCMPETCSAKDLESELSNTFKGLNAEVLVEEASCVVSDAKIEETFGKKITRVFFLTILVLIVVGTVFYSRRIAGENLNNVERVLRAFSLRRNFAKMIYVSSSDYLRGIDGARTLNAVSLLLAHKSMAALYNPYTNRTTMAEVLGMPWSIIGRSSIIYTDSFLFISGLLNARGLLKDLQLKGEMNFGSKLRSRIFRLLPLLVSVILFCTYILPDLGSGPQWRLVIEEHSHLCKSYMWRNFLFIHNFYGFPPMCLTHTHQIGIDMQLFLATPLIVWLLWHRPTTGLLVAFASAAISTALRYWIVIEKQMSMIVFFGISVDQLFKAANYSYTLPTHRATIYLAGVLVAYLLTKKISNTQFSKAMTWVLWTVALACGFLAQIGPWRMGLKGYVYEEYSSAIYAAFSPIVWGIFLSWALWASTTNHAGWFGDFLSWNGFKIFSKMAYAFYLVQFPVFFYNVGSMRTPEFYKPQVMFQIPEVGFIMLFACVATLCIEMPFMEIHNIFFGKTKLRINVTDNVSKASKID